MAAARNLEKSSIEILALPAPRFHGDFFGGTLIFIVMRFTDQAKEGLLIIYSELILCNFLSLCPGETEVANRGFL